jgi:dihydropteroate synthase
VSTNIFHIPRPVIVGIVNVTPDSFSDAPGTVVADAVARARRMVAEGADVLDVGGESTRPGAVRIDAAEQIRRVVPVIEALRAAVHVPISIDTTRSEVAAAAIAAGATILNDVSAGRDDPAMFTLAARHGCGLILMHMQGDPATMQVAPTYGDVVVEVRAFLLERAAAAEAAGVKREQIVIDPGIGFGKTFEHNIALLRNLAAFVQTGYPVMLGASRKGFLGTITGVKDAAERGPATAATTAMGVMAGVKLFRVHDVAINRQAADVTFAVMGHRSGAGG